MSLLVEMGDEESARYIMEEIIADGSGSNVPRTYTEDEGSQANMYLNMSSDGNDENEHNVDEMRNKTLPKWKVPERYISFSLFYPIYNFIFIITMY